MSFEFRLQAYEKGRLGWNVVSYDRELVTKKGQAVRLEGTAGVYESHVVCHDPARKLVVLKHKGYTSYIDRGTGNAYSPARFIVYEYREKIFGNEIHLYVGLFGIMELPLNWKPGFEPDGGQ